MIERTQELVTELLKRNEINPEDLISIIFTATDDIRSMFPAEAARLLGLVDVPLMCARELAVQGATERCIRVMAHVDSDLPRSMVRHVYQYGAAGLRGDLPQ